MAETLPSASAGLIIRQKEPTNLETPFHQVDSYLTPTELFYIRSHFPARLLHWTMAAMVWTMLCLGLAMVASLANYHVLVSIHRPLGVAILILVVVRFVKRLLNRPPPFPATMSRAERLAATASELTIL